MFEPSIRQLDDQVVAFLVVKGPYSLIPESYGTLYGWLAHQSLQPVGMPAAVYLTTPDETPESEALWELWAPVATAEERAADEHGLGIKAVPAHSVATATFKGPYDQIAPFYEQLFGWLGEQGYRPAGPPRELYLNDPQEVPPEEYLTEVQVPVIAA